MATIVPTFQNKSSKFRQEIILDGLAVTLILEWNSRAGYWFLTITDGIFTLWRKKLVANWPIFRQSRAAFPNLRGSIIALKTDLEAGPEVTYENLNAGWTLYYLTEEEVDQWEVDYGLR